MITKGMLTSNKDDWETPNDLYQELNKKYNFTLDPCSNEKNYKCKKHYTKKENGLLQDWTNEIIFMNPPYGKEIGKWIKKAYESKAKTIGLLPSRTDTKWFHDYIYNKQNVEIIFLKGRLKFSNSNPAPFPSMIVIWKNN